MTEGPWDRPPESGRPTDASGGGSEGQRPPADPIRRSEPERRPKRRLFTFWRVVAVIVLALIGWSIWTSAVGDGPGGPHVARHDVMGVITVDDERDALIRAIGRDSDARALVLRIDSPGGTATGAEALFAALRDVAAEKPVVAVMGEVAASGGYIAALAADHVLARGNTLTGSIGVVAQYPNFQDLLDRLGVDVIERRSVPFKALPSPFSETPGRVADWEAELLADSHAWFRDLVGERRGLEGPALDRVADGRVFNGRLALEAGLIDALGGLPEARAWLEGEGVPRALPLVERRVEEDRSLLAELLGLPLPGALAEFRRLAAGPRLYMILR